MPRLTLILAVGVAGGLGALSRYFLGTFIQRTAEPSTSFPWGTFAVNMLGCFLFGLIWILADQRGLLSPNARLIILTGFMGAFTTFSTFIFDSNTLLQEGQLLFAAGNILGQFALGLLSLIVGMAVGRFF